mgnify:CR=1 FL=1
MDDGTGTTDNDSDFIWSGSEPYRLKTENDEDIIFTLTN